MFLCIIFWNAKIIYYSYVFKEAKLAKFIRFEAGWKLYIFYHKVLGDVVKRWRFWGLWGTLEIVKTWSWNIFLYEEILHYAALRSEWQDYVFCSRLGIWIIFETQRFFIIPIFLRKQSWRNSFAMKRCGNWCGMRYEIRVFLSQSSLRWGEMMALLRTPRNIGNCEDVKLKYFAFWRDSSLCCASFRMTRFCFLLTIRILNYFWNT